jgi:tRNA A37 methylthiotransferase MiaB
MGSHFNGMSLGLSYLAAYLKKCDSENRIAIYSADYLEGDYRTQEELFDSVPDYDNKEIYSEIDSVLRFYKPDAVHITVLSPIVHIAKRIEEICKDKGIKVFAGGPHVILSEVKQFENEYKSLLFEEHLITPDRTSYLSDVDMGYIITGFGCSNDCSFCASKRLHKKIILRPVEDVIAEIKDIKANYTNELYFVDDTFTLLKKRTQEICKRIIKERIDIKWRCDTRLDRIDLETLKLMKRAGCYRVKVGVESGSEKILKTINKNLTLKEIRKKITLIKEAGISLTVYLMAGFPDETDDDVDKTIELAKEIEADYYSLSLLTPYPGTKLYRGQELGQNHQTKRLALNDLITANKLEEFLNANLKYSKGVRA